MGAVRRYNFWDLGDMWLSVLRIHFVIEFLVFNYFLRLVKATLVNPILPCPQGILGVPT